MKSTKIESARFPHIELMKFIRIVHIQCYFFSYSFQNSPDFVMDSPIDGEVRFQRHDAPHGLQTVCRGRRLHVIPRNSQSSANRRGETPRHGDIGRGRQR